MADLYDLDGFRNDWLPGWKLSRELGRVERGQEGKLSLDDLKRLAAGEAERQAQGKATERDGGRER